MLFQSVNIKYNNFNKKYALGKNFDWIFSQTPKSDKLVYFYLDFSFGGGKLSGVGINLLKPR
jgi:hypothetical protein